MNRFHKSFHKFHKCHNTTKVSFLNPTGCNFGGNSSPFSTEKAIGICFIFSHEYKTIKGYVMVTSLKIQNNNQSFKKSLTQRHATLDEEPNYEIRQNNSGGFKHIFRHLGLPVTAFPMSRRMISDVCVVCLRFVFYGQRIMARYHHSTMRQRCSYV